MKHWHQPTIVSGLSGRQAVLTALSMALLVLWGNLSSAPAQVPPEPPRFLDENCIVSVLNRNVQAQPDGSWVLPNVPANFGPVRARATCLVDGQTVSGESEPFVVPANGVVNLPRIALGQTTPIPTRLTISAPTATLTTIGDIIPLTVLARYVDGTQADVSSATAGTAYTISNPNIATISVDGVVQAVASGTVIVQATLDGATGMFTVRVALSGTDTDGDGIPDEVELQLGLDPNNPVDALEDFDRDDLTNLQEYLLGTDLRNPDTDGDGLTDGDEVNRHGTNPLLVDTDGDGVWDGLEIAVGTDPLDPTSYNLRAVLKQIAVTPVGFVLTLNTIVWVEAYQQLSVTGLMIDGNTLDLTSTTRGTNYTSSDLGVCSFGAPDGRVFAGEDGNCTITVTNSGFSAWAWGIVRSFAPTAVSSISIPGFANNVDVTGSMAYVAAGAGGLQVVDITDRSAPAVVGALATPGNANDVKVSGPLAYVADGASGLQIVDVSNPMSPTPVSSFDTPGVAWDVVVGGTRAYVADGQQGLLIIDVSNPVAPLFLGGIDPPGVQKGVDVDTVRELAVLASGTAGLHVIDVSNPATPVQVGAVSTGGDARDVVLSGTFAFVADWSRSLTVIDLWDPANPILVASTPESLGGLLNDVVVQGDFALGADVFFVNGVPIVNVSTPMTPVPRAILNFPGDFDAHGIAADGRFVYLAAAAGSAFIENGTTGTSRFFIGQYLLDDRGGVPPTVEITAPTANDVVIERTLVVLRAEATDDVGVASLRFLLNGLERLPLFSSPYETWTIAPAAPGTLVIGARATDLGGNVGEATPVSITIVPDPLTTTVGTVRVSGGDPVAGATVNCLGSEALSDANGRFAVEGLSSVASMIYCAARFTRPDGLTIGGSSNPFLPVPGGVTDVGEILLGGIIETFDGVVAPGLPEGWTTSQTGGGLPWVTTTTFWRSPPNAAATESGATAGSTSLTSPTFTVPLEQATLAFRNFWDFDSNLDGGVLEISIDGAPFADVLAAGGTFISGGYTGTISSSSGNPLGGRLAWTGNAGQFASTWVRLPPEVRGRTVQLRWRAGYDNSPTTEGTGWRIDTVAVCAICLSWF